MMSMRSLSSRCSFSALAVASLFAVTNPSVAQAQSASSPAAEEDADAGKDIVVTGTLLRGKAPVGSNAITISAAKLEETGASTTSELLASVPQVGNYFNNVPVAVLSIQVDQVQVSRPNIRGLSGLNSASSSTLILVDGHRIASAGVNQASVDPEVISTSAIERVEVVTDGGSAIYGADAVAGVINFITRKRFDGIKVDASYGFAKDYWQWDASAIAGKDWGSGSAWVSYSYTKNDSLLGKERGFIRNVDYSKAPDASGNYLGRDIACSKPNLALGADFGDGVLRFPTSYAAPAFIANTTNSCDLTDNRSVIPKAERHGLTAGLFQELSDNTSIEVRGFYGQRTTNAVKDMTSSVSPGALNPYVAPGTLPAGLVVGPGFLFGFPVTFKAGINFSMEPLLGPGAEKDDVILKTWGMNAELKQELGSGWQGRLLANWSGSDSFYRRTQLSPTRLFAAGNGTTLATAFNPINVINNNAALIADLTDSEIAGQARDNLINFRAIAEGALLTLPGGEARLAMGYEFINDKLDKRITNDVRIGGLSALPFLQYTRNVHSVFGELQLPLISNGDGGSMLTVSAAGRYDHYSDFGNTFNPKLGATFRPASWIALRGNWGTSFTAPTPVDQLGSLSNRSGRVGFVPFVNPADPLPAPPGSDAISINGSQSPLKPQTAKTWSVGIDLDPAPGLRASVTLYSVAFKNTLQTPTPDGRIFAEFPNQAFTKQTGFSAAEMRAFLAGIPNAEATLAPILQAGTLIYEMIDFRVGNYGEVAVKGLDFNANYTTDTGFGSVDFGVFGNVQLSRKTKRSPTSPINDALLEGQSKLTLQGVAGANFGNLRAQATVNHTAGYNITPTTSIPVQTKVGSFTTVNLFFKYDVPTESAMFKDLSLTLNVSNLFDKDPPSLRRSNPNEFGYANGFTLGRMFQIGVSKKF